MICPYAPSNDVLHTALYARFLEGLIPVHHVDCTHVSPLLLVRTWFVNRLAMLSAKTIEACRVSDK
jgi:hypothetical protein